MKTLLYFAASTSLAAMGFRTLSEVQNDPAIQWGALGILAVVVLTACKLALKDIPRYLNEQTANHRATSEALVKLAERMPYVCVHQRHDIGSSSRPLGSPPSLSVPPSSFERGE